MLPLAKYVHSIKSFSELACQSSFKNTQTRLDLLQVERGGASVLLLAGGAGLLELELAGSDGVASRLVGAGGHGLGDGQDETGVSLGDGESAGRLLAGALAVSDLGQGAVSALDQSLALDRGGLAVAGLDDTKGVAAEKSCQYQS